jgi:hypothetical protein
MMNWIVIGLDLISDEDLLSYLLWSLTGLDLVMMLNNIAKNLKMGIKFWWKDVDIRMMARWKLSFTETESLKRKKLTVCIASYFLLCLGGKHSLLRAVDDCIPRI